MDWEFSVSLSLVIKDYREKTLLQEGRKDEDKAALFDDFSQIHSLKTTS